VDIVRAVLGLEPPKLMCHANNTINSHAIDIKCIDTDSEPPNVVANSHERLSPLDNVCMRYWVCHQHLAKPLEDCPRWDMENIVVAACSFVRDVFNRYMVDYGSLSARLAICACYTISWKHNSDHHILVPPGHSFLTTCYRSMFLNLDHIATLETQLDTLHDAIEYIEGQIAMRLHTRMFAYSVLNPTCRLMDFAEKILAECENDIKASYFLVLRKVSGCFGALVQMCESYDRGLTNMFNHDKTPQDSATAWEDAFLLLFSNAAIHARVSSVIPARVSIHVSRPSRAAVGVAVRLVSMYLECHDRLRVDVVTANEPATDKTARTIISIKNMQKVLVSLQSIKRNL